MRLLSGFRLLVLSGASMALAACGDGPTAPPKMTAEAVANALPAIRDARLRLVEGILSPAVRERTRSDLEQIEFALVRHDAQASGFRFRLLRVVLSDYVSRPGDAHGDDADLAAIGLALAELSLALDLPLDFTLLR